jgi:hypothetical protein
MKMIYASLVLFASVTAQAAPYTCFAKANAENGFPQDFSVQLDSFNVGGSMTLTTNGQTVTLGTISQGAVLTPDDPTMGPAFQASLGLIAAPEVSGVAQKDLESITRLALYKTVTPSGKEILVYQLFAGDQQIGGTFYLDGIATACLPK